MDNREKSELMRQFLTYLIFLTGLRQEEFAERLDVSRAAVHLWRNSKSPWTLLHYHACKGVILDRVQELTQDGHSVEGEFLKFALDSMVEHHSDANTEGIIKAMDGVNFSRHVKYRYKYILSIRERFMTLCEK